MRMVLELAGYVLRMEFLAGYRTYVAAAGLVALGVYQFTEGQTEAATQSFLAGLAAFGIRQAIPQS